MQGQPGFQHFGQPPAQSPEQLACNQAKQAMRRDVKKTVLLVIGLLVGANVLSVLILLVYGVAQTLPALLSGSQVDTSYLTNLSSSMLMTFLTGYLPIMIAEIAVILIAWRILKLPFSRVLGHNRMGAGFTALGAFGCIGFGVIGQLITSLMLTVMELLHIPVYSPDFALDWGQPLGCWLSLVSVCVLGPILEELVFRGFILKALQRHGVSFAVIFSAFLFTLFHQNLVQFFVPFLLGIFLALLAVRSGSLLPSILAHIANNTIAMILDMVLPQDNPALYGIGYLIYAVIFLGVAAIFMILYLKELTPILKWRHPLMKLRTQLASALSHWPTVVFMVLYLLMILYTTLAAFLQNYLY